jgi:hypothetical protein
MDSIRYDYPRGSFENPRHIDRKKKDYNMNKKEEIVQQRKPKTPRNKKANTGYHLHACLSRTE